MRRKGSSFFLDAALRELDGSRVRKKPHLGDLMSEAGTVRVEHEGAACPPLAVSFCKSDGASHLLAISDEEGYVSLLDTRKKIGSVDYHGGRNGERMISHWMAHENAIFDLCWMKEGTLILSGSGDQTIRIWDVESKACIGIMTGHKGSVKSVCCHQSNQDLLVSGSRDGSFAIWDLRCKPVSTNSSGEASYCSTVTVMDTNRRPSPQKRTRRAKVASTSITSVLYLRDDFSIASATDSDSAVKFWDSRCLRSFVAQTSPSSKPSVKGEKASHGVSSLSQDAYGIFLTASCMNNKIYLYDMLHLDNGPIKSFSGSVIGSFYVKAAISPDATHILSGSSDENAYVWQVARPDISPAKLKGHGGEVTAVDWCLWDAGKVATSSDDYTVRVWDMKYDPSRCPRSPITNRKRITVSSESEFRDFLMDWQPSSSSPQKSGEFGVVKQQQQQLSSGSPKSPIGGGHRFGTPESARKRREVSFPQAHEVVEIQKTPEPATSNSPSSVLNPPPSLKRTIRDYFLATS